jgi:hypothetical protein
MFRCGGVQDGLKPLLRFCVQLHNKHVSSESQRNAWKGDYPLLHFIIPNMSSRSLEPARQPYNTSRPWSSHEDASFTLTA